MYVPVRTARATLRPRSGSPRPDRAAQSVGGIIRDLHGLLVSVVRDDRDYRPEDLLLGDPHAVVDVHEHGGLDEPAAVDPLRTTATDRDLGALFLTDLDVSLYPVALALGNEWAHLGRRVERISDLHGRH